MKTSTTIKQTVALLLTAILVLGLTVACGDRVSGERTANKPPEVFFVNIPPSGHQTSFDPAIYWVGTDADGRVLTFRYIVIRQDEMGGLSPDDYIAQTLMTLPRDRWTYLDVTTEDPKTTNIVSMSASLDDPINTYVKQYVFLQAFDDLGAGSSVVYRLFERNDNPPSTRFTGRDYAGSIFINSPAPGGLITGVRFQISGTDPDFADSLFEYRWKLYGPYYSDTINGGEYEALVDTFVVPVFVTADARVIRMFEGNRDTLIDTTLQPGDTIPTIDTVIYNPDTMSATSIYGYKDDIFDIENLEASPDLFKLIDSSTGGDGGWVSNNRSPIYRDSLYDIFRNAVSDTTTQQRFMIWGQCRDAAQVADVAPAFTSFQCVDPKYERDILVIDRQSSSGRVIAPPFNRNQNIDGARDYWQMAIDNWATTRTEAIDFDPVKDYIHTTFTNVTLGKMLGYKLIIVYNDGSAPAQISSFGTNLPFAEDLWTAIDAGVNVWGCWRSPLIGGSGASVAPNFNLTPSADYTRYFGVSRMVYSGWTYHCTPPPGGDSVRIEDFISALSLKSGEGWPDVAIDTNNLRDRYTWLPLSTRGGVFAWDVPARFKLDPNQKKALPEVDWSVRIFGTEPLYLYGSSFGPSHPLGADYTFDGAPVAIRYETNLYRTAHFNFTPLGMDDATMQIVIDSVLNWLYDPTLGQPTSSTRYPGARVTIDPQEVRTNFERRQANRAESAKLPDLRDF